MQTPMCMRSSSSAGRRRARRGHERKVRVRREPAAVATLEGDGAAARPRERAAVGQDATRVPERGDPPPLTRDRAARALDVDRERADRGPDAAPLQALDGVDTLDER